MRHAPIFATLPLLALIAAAPAPVREGPIAAEPAAQPFRLGALQLTAIRSGAWQIPNDGSVFEDKAEAARLLAAAGQSGDRIVMSVDALVVRMPAHLVLLDAGLGPREHGLTLQSLAKAGVSPLDVTDVLVTHSHLDHVGGLVDARGRPAFPNATIRMSAREWAAMQVSGETRALAAAIAGQVQTFEPPQEVLPCITARPLYGHTDGHVGYDLLSEGQRLEDIGDTAHAVVLQAPHPDWKDGYDADPTRGTPSRVAEFRRLAEAHELVFSPHFPFPGVGRLEVAGEGYVWRPGP